MRFSVTYEIVGHAEAEAGDTDRRGYALEDGTLREALEAIGHCAQEADSWPVRPDIRWITNYEFGHGTRAYFEQGDEESRSLHFPKGMSGASRLRVARLLGIKGA